MPVTFDNNRKMLRIVANVRSNVPEALLQAGKDVVTLASQLAPVGEGKGDVHLADSGKAELTGTRTVSITFGNGLPDRRAQAQEYGTVFMPAQPYLTPALRAIDILHYVRIAVFQGT